MSLPPPKHGIIINITYGICAIAAVLNLGSIYLILNVWLYRKHPFIKARKPGLTYSVLWIFFALLLLAIGNAVLYHEINPLWDIRIFIFVDDLVQYGCILPFAVRAWILFYSVQWSHECRNMMWVDKLSKRQSSLGIPLDARKKSIDNCQVRQKNKFWDNHRSTLGNYKKVFPVAMLVVFPILLSGHSIIPGMILHKDNEVEVQYVTAAANFVCHVIFFGGVCYWIYRILRVHDKFEIGHELKYINFVWIVFLTLGQMVKIVLFDPMPSSSESDRAAFVLISTLVNVLCILPSLYIGSLFVLRALFSHFGRSYFDAGGHELTERKTLESVLFCCGVCSSASDDVVSRYDSELDDDNFPLDEVLKTQIGFEKFSQFLITEWSVENILFLIEVKQFKARCRTYHKDPRMRILDRHSAGRRVAGHATPLHEDVATDDDKDDDEETKASPRGIHVLSLDLQSSVSHTMSTESVPDGTRISFKRSLSQTTTTRERPDVFHSTNVMAVEYVPQNDLLQKLELYEYAKYLYEKYVQNDSEFEVNLPSKSRSTLDKFFAQMRKKSKSSKRIRSTAQRCLLCLTRPGLIFID